MAADATPLRDPLRPMLDSQGVAIIDGALATELERRGADLRDALWSARLLLDAPDRRTPLEVARWFGAMQAQDVASGHWSLGVRCEGAAEPDVLPPAMVLRQGLAAGQPLSETSWRVPLAIVSNSNMGASSGSGRALGR